MNNYEYLYWKDFTSLKIVSFVFSVKTMQHDNSDVVPPKQNTMISNEIKEMLLVLVEARKSTNYTVFNNNHRINPFH